MRKRWMLAGALAACAALAVMVAVPGCGKRQKPPVQVDVLEPAPPCPNCGKTDKVCINKYTSTPTQQDLQDRRAGKLHINGPWFNGALKWWCSNPECVAKFKKQPVWGFGPTVERP